MKNYILLARLKAILTTIYLSCIVWSKNFSLVGICTHVDMRTYKLKTLFKLRNPTQSHMFSPGETMEGSTTCSLKWQLCCKNKPVTFIFTTKAIQTFNHFSLYTPLLASNSHLNIPFPQTVLMFKCFMSLHTIFSFKSIPNFYSH